MREPITITPNEYNKYKKFVLENRPENWLYIARKEAEISSLKATIDILNAFFLFLKKLDYQGFNIKASLPTECLVDKINEHFIELDCHIRTDYIKGFLYGYYNIHILNNNYSIEKELKHLDDIPSWLELHKNKNGDYCRINLLPLCLEFILYQKHMLQLESGYLPNSIKGAYEDAQKKPNYDDDFGNLERELRIADISNALDEEEDSIERERLINELERLRDED